MAFPDLQLVPDVLKGPGATLPYSAEATGVPDNGNNTFGLPFVAAGIDPKLIEPSIMEIVVEPDPARPAGGSASPGVTDARFVSLSADKQFMTIAFAQSGTGNARVTVNLVHTLQGVGSVSSPVITISSKVDSGGPSVTPALIRNFVAGVLVNDVVYETAVADQVDRADASSVATGLPLGIVRTLNSPGVGQCLVVPITEDFTGFAGLTPGAQFILSTSPGAIVGVADTGDPNYPAFLTPGSGEVLAPVGIAAAANKLAVNVGAGIVAVG